MTLVITTCTNRKRKPIPDSLHAADLPQAEISGLAAEWGRRLTRAPKAFSARDIYGGRAFQEASLAAEFLDAQLIVVSAGLGLIAVGEPVPPYACTVVVGAPDSIATKSLGRFTAGAWWQALKGVSPYHQDLEQTARDAGGMICAALSDTYIDMLAADLVALPKPIRERMRLFTRAPIEKVVADLRPYVMPYDDRLDGLDSPVRGTRGDFAARALRHFAEFIAKSEDGRSCAEHAEAVRRAQSGWRMAPQFDRRRLDDSDILALIRTHWERERGSSTRLLRLLRDSLGIACEQGRFAALARQVRDESV